MAAFALDTLELTEGENWVLSRNLAEHNLCTRLEVRTSEGVFITEDVAGYGSTGTYGGSEDGVIVWSLTPSSPGSKPKGLAILGTGSFPDQLRSRVEA